MSEENTMDLGHFPNLAGDMRATQVVLQELRAVGAYPREAKLIGEVPSLINGVLVLGFQQMSRDLHVNFSRAWYYWIVSLDHLDWMGTAELEALREFNEVWGRSVRLFGFSGGMSWEAALGHGDGRATGVPWRSLYWHVDAPEGLQALVAFLEKFGTKHDPTSFNPSYKLYRVTVDELGTTKSVTWVCRDIGDAKQMIDAIYFTWGSSPIATAIWSVMRGYPEWSRLCTPEGVTYTASSGEQFNVYAEYLDLTRLDTLPPPG